MKCPFCINSESRVVDSRTIKDGQSIRRRRECLECGKRFTTYEYIQEFEILVFKRDERREPYDRGKLLKSINLACSKRPISVDKIENLANRVENLITHNNHKEISSRQIGEYVMVELQKIDKIAYVRFASVYRDFKDIGEFMNEITKLLENEK